MKRPKRNHSPHSPAKVALETLNGEKTIAQLAAHDDVHANQVTIWKTQLLENAVGIFGAGVIQGGADRERMRELRAKNGELTVERDFRDFALGRSRPLTRIRIRSSPAKRGQMCSTPRAFASAWMAGSLER